LFGAFSWIGICVVDGGDGVSCEAFSGAGINVVGAGDGGCSFGIFSWIGICVVGGDDGGFLFGAFFWAVGRAPNFWKYKLQVVDSSMR
jgi:hypothetical protein